MCHSCPSSSDITAIVGFHLAVYLQWSSGSVDPVVPRWSSGVAVMYLLAGGGRVHLSKTRADQLQLSHHLLQNVASMTNSCNQHISKLRARACVCVCVCSFSTAKHMGVCNECNLWCVSSTASCCSYVLCVQCTRGHPLYIFPPRSTYVLPSDLSCPVVSERAKAHVWATHQASWTVASLPPRAATKER